MLRTLAAFFALGALIAYFVRANEITLTVRVPAGASDLMIATAIDEALMIEVGLRDWRSDPLVVDRLQRLVTAAGAGTTDVVEALLRRDPLLRARMIDRGRLQLERVPAPSDAELEVFRSLERNAFARPAMHRIAHTWIGEGPPDLGLGAVATRSEAAFARTLGSELARDIAAAAPGTEFRSSERNIRVLAHLPPELPPLDMIRAEVHGAWLADARAQARSDGLARLRAAIDVDVEVVE